MRQGDVFMLNMTENAIGHEQKGVRPVLVASTNVRNDVSPNVFIFPITHAKKKKQPCHYILNKSDYPFFTFDQQTVICEEGRSVSKDRLERYLGRVSPEDMLGVLLCKEYIFIEK